VKLWAAAAGGWLAQPCRSAALHAAAARPLSSPLTSPSPHSHTHGGLWSPLAAVRPSPGGPPTDPAFAELGEAAAPSRPPKTPRIRAAPHPLRWFTVLAAGSSLPRFVSSLFYPTYCSLDAKVSRITGTTSRKACI